MTSSKHVTEVSLVASGALEEGAQGRRKARGRGAEKQRGRGAVLLERSEFVGAAAGEQVGVQKPTIRFGNGTGTASGQDAGPCPGRELRSGGVCGRPGSQPLTREEGCQSASSSSTRLCSPEEAPFPRPSKSRKSRFFCGIPQG